MENKKFCHLHLHTEYSLLDSSAKIKKVINKAKELGMESTMGLCMDVLHFTKKL